MSSIFLFAQDHGKSESSYFQLQNGLHEKLKEISEQIKRDGVSIPDVLRPLTRGSIQQSVISPSHIAFRLEDGQVCRVAYTIDSDRLSQKPDRKRKQGMSYSDSSNTVREGAVSRTANAQHGSRSYRSPLSVLGRTSRGISFLREMQRQGIYLARPVAHQIPESEIPEVLIEECQTVLQGKSRQVIVRELQNTNLDVNMAVNNLLSRDDEAEQGNSGNLADGNIPGASGGGNSDDWDDEAVELLSFFEYPDSHGFLETDGLIADEMAGPPTSPRFRADLSSDYEYGFLSDRRKRRRMESHLYSRGNELYSGRNAPIVNDSTYNRSVADSLRNSTTSDSVNDHVKQTSSSTRYYIQLSDVLEFWPDPENSESNFHFVHIVALHSELVALTAWGELHQWRWADSAPFFMHNTTHVNPASLKEVSDKKIMELESTGHAEQSFPVIHHPRVLDLGLVGEKVIKLSGCATRATVLTATGKFATWMDESLMHSLSVSYPFSSSSGSLGIEHQAVWFSELRDETVVEIHTAPLVTVIRCLSGSVYWWGIYPSYMRQRAIEKMRQNRVSTVSKRNNISSKNSVSRRYSLSQQSSSNSTSEMSNPVTMDIHPQNVTDMLSSSTGIVPGSFVCIRSAPIFHAGAVGFTVIGGVPKVGTLLEDAWKTTDVCRFRVNVMNSTSSASGINESSLHHQALSSDSGHHILTCPYALGLTVHSQSISAQCSASLGNNVSGIQFSNDQVSISSSVNNSTLTFQEMPPPPSPASSTCSDQSGPVRVSPGTFKRKKAPSISSDRSERIVGDWDIGNQNSGRGVRGRSADRDSSVTISTIPANKRGSADSNHDVTDVTTRSDGGCNRVLTNLTVIEEDWCLSDVVFIEDGRTQPVGIVLKVDGNIAAVKFLKEQERSCVAANCPYSPACILINNILGIGSSLTTSTSNSFSQILPTSADPMSWLNDCRLLRKEDLTIVRNAGSVRVPDVIQRTPRRVLSAQSASSNRNSGDSRVGKGLPSHSPKILAIAVENSRIHVIAEQVDDGSHQSALYQVYNLSGKLIINQRMPVSASALKPISELKDGSATLTCPSEHPLLLRDPSGLVLPFIPPSRTASHEMWTSSMSVDLPPVLCASFSWIRNNLPSSGVSGGTNGRQSSKSQSEQQPRCLFGVVVIQDLTLMHHILRANDIQIEKLLTTDISSLESLKVACELADGRRNLLHMAVSMCAPQSNRETSPEWLSKLEPILASPLLRSAFEERNKPVKEATESSDNSAMKVVSSNASSRQPSFCTDDLTPFMLAIKIRAYSVARFLYDTTRCIAELSGDSILQGVPNLPIRTASDQSVLDFFSPASQKLDDSPLFQLCYNDTCSFTWTGPDHIRQDIFECRTCGLMDSLCCCTECARVCHKGHDCRLKRTSPTAYCDCWEKCCCQSLISGFQAPRHELFYRLLSETKLIYLRNARGEHLLLYLAKCMERQTREQRQHRPSRRRLTSTTSRTNPSCNPPVTSASNATSNWESNNGAQSAGPEEPDHDLEPPRFARDAFELVLDCPVAVYSMLTLDNNSGLLHTDDLHQKNGFVNEDQVFLLSQGGTNQLDDFVFTLICKCPPELTDILLSTLNRSITNFPSSADDKKMKVPDGNLSAISSFGYIKQCDYPSSVEMASAAARFVRSVARIYASLSLELSADQKKKSRLGLAQPTLLDICRRVFSSLAPIAINELPMLAASLLVPIRTGTVRPCASFSFTSQSSEVTSGLELLINAERNNCTRQQLLSSSEALKSDDHLPTRGIQRSMSIDDGYRHQPTFSVQPAYHSVAESVIVPSLHQHNVISTLNVELSTPHVPTSDALESDTTKYTNGESNIEVASPNTVTSSIHDPSLLTLQMQSTITDIETNDSEHTLAVRISTTDTSCTAIGSELNNSSSVVPNVSNSSSLNFVCTPNFSVSTCANSIFQIQSSGEAHTSTYESTDGNVVGEETSTQRIGDLRVTHSEAVDSGTWSYPRREESGYHSHIFPLISDDRTVDEPCDDDMTFSSGFRRCVTESSCSDFCKRRRTIEPDVSSPESKDDTIQIDCHVSYSLSPSAQDELPLSVIETDATVSQTSSTAVTLGSTADLDIRSELSSNMNTELHPSSNLSTNVVPSQLESSADAGSRSASPTWVTWPRTSIFSRLSSRAVSQSSDSIVNSSNAADALNSNRHSTSEINTITTSQSFTTVTSANLQGRNTSNLLPGRRSVQSVISLLNTSTSATPTLVISSTGNINNTPVSSETTVTNSTSSVTTATVSANVGCTMTTQVYLCRTFACLLRVTADLLTEIQGELNHLSNPLRRCMSVPTSVGLPLSVYEQQRRLPIYCSSTMVATSTASANTQPHTLVSTSSNSLSSVSYQYSGCTDNQSPTARGRLIRSCTAAISLSSDRTSTIKLDSDLHCVQLVASVGVVLIPVWQWATMAMDNLEAQLRFSASWNACLPNKNATNYQSKVTDNQDGVNSIRDVAISSSSQVSNDMINRRTHASNLTSRRPIVSNTSSSSTATNTRLLPNDPIANNNSTDTAAVVLGQRQDFLAYLFSIMRTSGGDHGDSVPFVDPQVNKHLAYILGALLYFFRAFESAWPSGVTRQLASFLPDLRVNFKLNDTLNKCIKEIGESSTSYAHTTQMCFEKTSEGKNVFTADQITQRNDPFFRRSESILSLSGLGPDLLDAPLSESLPLALQPQLLQPTSGRTELFGCDRFLPIKSATHVSSFRKNDHIPIHMNAMSSTWGERMCGGNIPETACVDEIDSSEFPITDMQQLMIGARFLDSVGHSATLLSRWCSVLEFFGRHFPPDVGAENGSYMFELGGFSAKEGRFRKQMERLRNMSRRDLILEVERERGPLILNTIKLLNMEYAKRQTQTPLPNLSNSSNGSVSSANNFPLQYVNTSSHQRDSPSTRQNANTNQVAIALLLGTTTDSPLMGTLFGASPTTPTTSVTSSSILSGQQQPILSCRRIKVTFKDEPGEGSGVARSFFTAFSDAVLSQESLPNLGILLQNNSSNSLSNQQPHFHRHYTVLSRSQSNNSTNRPTTVLVQSTTSSLFQLSTQSTISISNSTYSQAVLSNSLNPGQQTVPVITPTTIHSSISFYPYQLQSRLHTYTVGSRPRLSAWRRSGGLSANAPPFYPSAAQAAFSSSDLSPADSNSQTSSRNPSPARYSDISNSSHITVANVCSLEVSPSIVLDSCAPVQSLTSSSAPSDNTNRNILQVNYEPSNSNQCPENGNSNSRHDLANGRSVGGRLFTRVQSIVRNEHLTARITGMLLELPSSEHSVLLANEEALSNRVEEARALITMSDSNEQNRVERPRTPSVILNQPDLERLTNWQGMTLAVAGATSANVQSNTSSSNAITELLLTEDVERVPLFWQPGLQGYYFPRAIPGINLPSNQTCDSVKLAARYSIYRGVGRVIGLCLLTNETCPLHFSRPVLKYILGRVIHWHDFAFYDPTTFEGLRQLLLHTSEDSSKPQGSIEDYNLTFSLIPALEEGGLPSTDAARQPNANLYTLVPGGDEVEVNESNVFEFVKKYTEFKMRTAVQEPLEQLRQGVFDVLPRNSLDGLTAEDLRLLLNGTGDIDVDVLSGYTTFLDETGTGSNVDLTKSCDNTNLVNRLKKWFWCTVRNMDTKQRQDLLYFWTSSPTLPASAQGFQPMPSITIRPPDDHHLPSANTCISRLYLPLYSSRHILRDKLLQAIMTKSFGFV
ncbi:E3 ubiquitin-protein ligase [Schistosoma japonicum]|nr:E3 ubiquitin-protein ligase [Schistosoma japonicum]KAH8852578.1 E3 ubiquitin-protein ligase [Schistosoma japonicum]